MPSVTYLPFNRLHQFSPENTGTQAPSRGTWGHHQSHIWAGTALFILPSSYWSLHDWDAPCVFRVSFVCFMFWHTVSSLGWPHLPYETGWPWTFFIWSTCVRTNVCSSVCVNTYVRNRAWLWVYSVISLLFIFWSRGLKPGTHLSD